MMFEVQKISDKRIDMHISGRLTADDMAAGMKALDMACDGLDDGQLLYKLTDIKFPTFGALAEEMKWLPKILRNIGKFKRCAILCDTKWIRTAAKLENLIVPHVKIETFTMEELEKALEWLGSN